MSHEEFLRDVRSLNAFLAAFGVTLMIMETHDLWHTIRMPRRLRYVSLCMFAIAICYGSLESAYWPEHNLRVLWITLSCISLVISGVCGNMESNRIRKRNLENKKGVK